MAPVYEKIKNGSRVTAVLLLIIIAPIFTLSQPANNGSLAFLQSSNGFKGITLGTDDKRLDSFKLAYLDGNEGVDVDSCVRFAYQDEDIKDLGDGLSLNLVGIRTYKGKIVNIYLFFNREDGYRVLKNFEAQYGKFTSAPGDFMYDWDTNGLKLSLRYEVDVDLGVATFTCKKLEEKIASDKLQAKLQAESQLLTEAF